MNAQLRHPSLRGRVVVITGGSRGFGWSIAQELLKAGANVVLTAHRSPGDLERAHREADVIAGQGHCLAIRADVSSWSDCKAAIDAALDVFGRIDVLINNAGRGSGEYDSASPQNVPFYEIPAETFRTIIETNLIGAFHMTKAVMPHFIGRKFGKVISISTSLTTMTMRGFSPYGASKAGLELTHRVWADELQGTGVDVNILLPGGASDTGFVTQAMVSGDIGSRKSLLSGTVVVAPATWLCTDATNGLTGRRFIAKHWDHNLPPAESLHKCMQPQVEQVSLM